MNAADQKVLDAMVDSGRLTPAEMVALKKLIDSMQESIDAQARLVHELADGLESVLSLQGPDAGTRRRMLELAATVTTPTGTYQALLDAALKLGELVIKHIPAPRPVAVPAPVVSVEKENEAC